jgi:hypothetical protein
MNPVTWVRVRVEAFTDRLHAGEDERALEWGWTVERLPWGGRRYRDPRFDLRAAQPVPQLESQRPRQLVSGGVR